MILFTENYTYQGFLLFDNIKRDFVKQIQAIGENGSTWWKLSLFGVQHWAHTVNYVYSISYLFTITWLQLHAHREAYFIKEIYGLCLKNIQFWYWPTVEWISVPQTLPIFFNCSFLNVRSESMNICILLFTSNCQRWSNIGSLALNRRNSINVFVNIVLSLF